jgi:hypothetical protein
MQVNKLHVFLNDFNMTFEKNLLSPRLKPSSPNMIDQRSDSKSEKMTERPGTSKRLLNDIGDHLSNSKGNLGSLNARESEKIALMRTVDENSVVCKSFKISQKRFSAAHIPKIEKIVADELKLIKTSAFGPPPGFNLHTASDQHASGLDKSFTCNKSRLSNLALKGKLFFLNPAVGKPHLKSSESQTNNVNTILIKLPERTKKLRLYSVKPTRTFSANRHFM